MKYLILCLALIGCVREAKVGECFHDMQDMYQVQEVGTLSMKVIDPQGKGFVFYSNEVDRDNFVNCFDKFECYKNTGVKNETCKLPRESKSKKDKSTSKDEAK